MKGKPRRINISKSGISQFSLPRGHRFGQMQVCALQGEDVAILQISWLPIFEFVFIMLTIIIVYFIYILQGRMSSTLIPTVSETARYMPGTLVFTTGIGVVGICFTFLGLIIVDMVVLNGYESMKYMRFVPYLICIFLVALACVTLSDRPSVHSTFATLAFVTLWIFCLVYQIMSERVDIITMKVAKLTLLCVSSASVVLFVFLAIPTETDEIESARAMLEYTFLATIFGYLVTWKWDMRNIEMRMIFK